MATSGNPDSGSIKSTKDLDLHQGLTSKRGNETNSPADVQKSEHDQICSPDGFPRFPGSNRRQGSRSDPAAEFWSQGLARLKAHGTRSKGNGKDGKMAAPINESRSPPFERDTAKSASTDPRDELHLPRFQKISNIENEPKSLPPGHPLRLPAPDLGLVDQSLEVEAKKGRSPTPASAPCPSKGSLTGNECKSSKDDDAIPSHTKSVSRTGITCVENEDSLTVRPASQKIEPARPITPTARSETSCLGGESGLSPFHPRQTLKTPSKPIITPKHSGLSTISPTAHPFEPRSILPKTPNSSRGNTRIEHLKSFSADTSAGYSSPSSGSSTAPWSYFGHDHQRSVSLGSGEPHRSFEPVMSMTPTWQPHPGHFEQTSMRNLPIPRHSGVQPSPPNPYPAPKQYMLEGQGQGLDTGSMPLQMPAYFPHPIISNEPSFPSSLHSFHTNTIHQNAQVYKQGEQNAEFSQPNHFDSYATSQAANAAPSTADLHQDGNIYTQDTNDYGPRYYSTHTDPTHQARLCPLRKDHLKLIKTQLNQNLYSPLEPHREPSKPNQRTAKDMFIPEDLRLKLHARTEATLRVFAGKLLRYRTSQHGFVDIRPSESFSNEHTRRRTLPYSYAFDSR